jgi:predicted nucleotidyltransferase
MLNSDAGLQLQDVEYMKHIPICSIHSHITELSVFGSVDRTN